MKLCKDSSFDDIGLRFSSLEIKKVLIVHLNWEMQWLFYLSSFKQRINISFYLNSLVKMMAEPTHVFNLMHLIYH